MDYGHPVRFGVFITPAAARPYHALDVATVADELGFDLVGVQDHPYQSRFLDTWTLLTAMAMRTYGYGSFLTCATFRCGRPRFLPKTPPHSTCSAMVALTPGSGRTL